MRKLVRLTEGDLHRIIENSVKQALNELDWKTYANAGNKAMKGGSISAQRELDPTATPPSLLDRAVSAKHRANRFFNKATNQFNQDYGHKNGHSWDDDYSSVDMGGDFNSGEEFSPHARGYQKNDFGSTEKYEHGWKDYGGEMTPEEFFKDPQQADRYRKADAELKNYKRGNYEYQKGKGWKLK